MPHVKNNPRTAAILAAEWWGEPSSASRPPHSTRRQRVAAIDYFTMTIKPLVR